MTKDTSVQNAHDKLRTLCAAAAATAWPKVRCYVCLRSNDDDDDNAGCHVIVQLKM